MYQQILSICILWSAIGIMPFIGYVLYAENNSKVSYCQYIVVGLLCGPVAWCVMIYKLLGFLP